MKNLFTAIFFSFFVLSIASTDLPFADAVLVEKSKRKMYLISDGKKYREYDISLGDNPIGHKQKQGDERTPEGKYTIPVAFDISVFIARPFLPMTALLRLAMNKYGRTLNTEISNTTGKEKKEE